MGAVADARRRPGKWTDGAGDAARADANSKRTDFSGFCFSSDGHSVAVILLAKHNLQIFDLP